MAQEKQNSRREYLDFSRDPVVPTGITGKIEAKIVKDGWKKITLDHDVPAHGQFKNKEGDLYFLDGWIKKGTEVFVLGEPKIRDVSDRFGIIQMCGNPVIVGEEKYGW